METFSVYQFFIDNTHERVRSHVDAEEAFKAFQHYTTSVAVKLRFVKEVIITDSGDYTVAQWILDKGLVFPTKEIIEESKKIEEAKKANQEKDA